MIRNGTAKAVTLIVTDYTRSLRGKTLLGHYGPCMLWVYSA